MRSHIPPGKTAEALRQVSTLPHRASDGVDIILLYVSKYAYCCGVGVLHLDRNMISYCQIFGNCHMLHFLPDSIGHSADCKINCSLAHQISYVIVGWGLAPTANLRNLSVWIMAEILD